MDHEEQARQNHRCGFNCAQSVYAAFADRLGVSVDEARRMAPLPRGEGGKCGAYLAGMKLLRQLRPEAADRFERDFCALNGEAECRLMVAAHRVLKKTCNDYVADAARLVDAELDGD